MTIIRAIIFLLQFTLLPVAFGRLITYKVKNPEHRSPIVTYVVGLFGMLGIFFLMCSAFTWYQNFTMVQVVVTGGFTHLSICYSILEILVMILWIIFDFKSIKDFSGAVRTRIKNLFSTLAADKFSAVYMAVFAVLLVVQLYFSFAYEVNEWSYDDFDYVVNSVDDIAFDQLSNVSVVDGENPFTEPKRAATSWPAFIAFLSYTSHFDVTTVCHTILPVILLLVAYAVFYYMSVGMFDRLDNRFIFLSILSVVFIFGLFSHFSLTFRLLCTLWQGKAVLCAIVLPFLFVYLPSIFKDQADGWNMLPILAVSLGASSLTTMSMLLLGLEFLIMWVAMSIYSRKPASLRYLVAGLLGPGFQLGFYTLISMLLQEQLTPGKIWFG